MTTESLAITIEGEVLTVEIGTVAAPAGGGSSAWGDITGTLSAQTDLQSALDLKAPLASPTLTGTPAAPTAAGATSTTQIATTAFVGGEITTHAGAADPHGDRSFATSAISTHSAVTTAHGITAFGASLVDDANAAAARTTLGLGTAAVAATGDFAAASHAHAAADITSGTLVHERGGLEADVSAYSGLVKITGGVTSAVTVTTAGEALLDDASAADQRTTLGLGTAATTAATDYATAAQGTDDRTASGLRSATTVVSVSAATAPTSGQVLTATSSTAATWQDAAAGSGDVVGPASSTDSAVARFDSTTGKLLQNTANVTIADTGAMTITPDANATALTVASHTQTASAPVLDLAQTWNDAAVTFTGVKVNVTSTASAAASLLQDWQVGGASQASITKGGLLRTNGTIVSNTGVGLANSGSTPNRIGLALAGIALADGYYVAWSSNTGAVTPLDTYLYRDAAATLALRNSTTAQTFRVYDTFTDSSNYARLALNAGAAGDWVQIAAETAGTGADNYGIALTPAGTGAISAQVPDSTTAGGNARGANAVDLSLGRVTNANRVASGNYAFCVGYNQMGTGDYSTCLGANQQATGFYSTAIGNLNFATSFYTLAAGYDSVADADTSFAIGKQCWTRGLNGAFANCSGGQRAARGDAQTIKQTARRTTAAITTVQLSTDGAAPAAATCMVLPNNSGCMFTATVAAYQSTGAGGWKIEGTGYRGANAASTVIQGGTTITAFGIVAGIGAPTVDVVADTTLGALVIQVTPANTTSTYWVGKLELVQVA